MNINYIKSAMRLAVGASMSVWALAGYPAMKAWEPSDYIQNGLLVNYDAIRNVGANLPHDPTAKVWYDVSATGGNSASLTVLSGQDAGAWTDDSYEFNFGSYWKMDTGVALGTEFTIQCVCDVDDGKLPFRTDYFPNYFGCNNDFSIYSNHTDPSGSGAQLPLWKTTTYAGVYYTQFKPGSVWNGRYISAAFDAEKTHLADGPGWSSTAGSYGSGMRTMFDPVPAIRYCWGSSDRGATTRSIKGEFHAVRLYSRKLTDAELAWNRAVDEHRFFGGPLPKTNVVVTASISGCDELVGSGSYAIEGSETFKCPESLDDGFCTYSVGGYKLESRDASTGTWTEVGTYTDLEYTYVVGSSPDCVRVTWQVTPVAGIRRIEDSSRVADAVLVVSDRIGVNGHESGMYQVYGSYVFAAPTVSTPNREWACTGYWLQTWDSANNRWTDLVAHDGATCELSAGAGAARRLIWLWQPTRGLRTAADYGIRDYVSVDVIGHYDAICNVGADVPHDNGATTWKDLSPSANDLTFAGADSSTGYWKDSAYHFAGTSLAKMNASLPLGIDFTIQVLTDTITDAEQIDAYPNLLCATFDYGVFWYHGQAFDVQWKADSWGKAYTRPVAKNWNGHALTLAMDSDRLYAFEGTAKPTTGSGQVSRFDNAGKPFGSHQWSIGAAHPVGNYDNTRHLIGDIRNVRFYSRVLEDSELERNRKVDDIRYGGALTTTNVVVASDTEGAAGVEPNGAYEVEGTWTFTAAPVRVTSDVKLWPMGYVLERRESDAWVKVGDFVGTNYTHTVTQPVETVRLTWKWGRKGMILIFR